MLELCLLGLICWTVASGHKWFLFLFDRERWDRERQREHESRMENKRMATGIFGLIRKFFGG